MFHLAFVEYAKTDSYCNIFLSLSDSKNLPTICLHPTAVGFLIAVVICLFIFVFSKLVSSIYEFCICAVFIHVCVSLNSPIKTV